MDEFGVFVELVSDILLDTNLQACTLRLFGWCFQDGQLLFSFRSLDLSDRLHGNLHDKTSDARPKHLVRNARKGGSDPTDFWAAEGRRKWGRSRPICGILRSDFRRGSACKSLTINSVDRGPGEESGEEEAEVCSSYVLHIALLLPSRVWYRTLRGTRARQRTKCRSGLERPQRSFGHEQVAKSGVAPAQHGVLPASKLSILSGANSSPWRTCSIAEVNARVTDRVICVFHAPVTLPRCRKRLRLFEIVKPSTIKEALKKGKVRKNF